MKSKPIFVILLSCVIGCNTLALHACGRAAASKDTDALTEGNRLLRAGKFSDAITCFDKALALDPKCAEAYLGRARAKHLSPDGEHQMNERQAREDCCKAISLDPKSAEAHSLRGTCYDLVGDYEKALRDLDDAVQLDPQNANRYINRGNAYRDVDRSSQALKDYKYALRLDPNNIGAYVNRANIYNDLGQYDNALKDSNSAIELVKAGSRLQPLLEPIIYTNRGRAYLGQGQFDKAVTDFSKVISFDPRISPGTAFHFRAQAYAKLGKSQTAAMDNAQAKKFGYRPQDCRAVMGFQLQ